MTEGTVEPTPTAPRPAELDLGERARMRLRHTWRLGREVGRYGSEQRMWWLLPAVLVLLLFALAVTTTSAALPVAVYALF